jgi:hypothetical protein
MSNPSSNHEPGEEDEFEDAEDVDEPSGGVEGEVAVGDPPGEPPQ